MIFPILFFVILVSWLVSKTIDIDKIDVQECLSCARMAPDGSRPFWVKKVMFQKCRFYDWTKLDSHQWTRLHDGILDYYDHIEGGQIDIMEEDPIYKYAMINEEGLDTFVASCKILLLMIVDLDIMSSYNRFDAFNARIDALTQRYQKENKKRLSRETKD